MPTSQVPPNIENDRRIPVGKSLQRDYFTYERNKNKQGNQTPDY